MNTTWGIDLGGTKIEGVVMAAGNLPDSVLLRKRIDTEAHKGYAHIVQQIKKLIAEMEAESGHKPTALGIGTPGAHDPLMNTMKGCNTTCLNGMPLRDDLRSALNLPVEIANDANCFALAEATMGVVPEVVPTYRSVFGVIMGTGVGGGIVMRGKDGVPFVLNGLQGIAGEWGHNVLDPNGHQCYCGKRGCNEQVLSGPALQRFYSEQSGVALSMKQIVMNYRAGNDPHALATMNRLFDCFGRAISVVINILDPDVIVLGGGVSNIEEIYTNGVESARQYVFNRGNLDTRFLKPKLGDSAGVFGAAMLVV